MIIADWNLQMKTCRICLRHSICRIWCTLTTPWSFSTQYWPSQACAETSGWWSRFSSNWLDRSVLTGKLAGTYQTKIMSRNGGGVARSIILISKRTLHIARTCTATWTNVGRHRIVAWVVGLTDFSRRPVSTCWCSLWSTWFHLFPFRCSPSTYWRTTGRTVS